jgi:hypothetical protein
LITSQIHGQNLISFKEDDKYGFKNSVGEIIVKPKYDDVGWKFFNGLVTVEINYKVGVMDSLGREIIKPKYQFIDITTNEEIMGAELNDLWGYIDKKGEIVVPIEYEEVRHYKYGNGLYKVKKNGKYGFISRDLDVIIPCKYSELSSFCNGYALIEIGGYNPDNTYEKYRPPVQIGFVDSSGIEYLSKYTHRWKYYQKITKIPNELFENKSLFKTSETKKLNREIADSLYTQYLNHFKYPTRYLESYCKIKNSLIAYGLSISGQTWGIIPENKKEEVTYLKKNTVYRIIASETLRNKTWNLISGQLKIGFKSSNKLIQKAYKEIALYLKNYINNYDRVKVEKYLRRDEKKFAYYDMDGKLDSNRKLSAFVDRLIIIHKVISVDDAKAWINRIADDVAKW